MFITAIFVILIISFLLSLKALRNLNDKPKISAVKRSLDKNRVIFKSHSSSS